MSESVACAPSKQGNAKSGLVALFVPSLGGGGAERIMLKLAGGLAARGLNVDLVLVAATGDKVKDVPPSVRIVDLQCSRVVLATLPLARYLRTHPVLALLATPSHANLVALAAHRIARSDARVVVREATTISAGMAHSTGLKSKLVLRLARHMYRWADAVVAPSNGAASDLIETIGISAQSVHVIHNPTVDAQIENLANEPNPHPWLANGAPPVILGVGRLTRAKDFETLIRAFALVRRKRDVRLIILGEGEARPQLAQLVSDLDLKHVVEMPGFVQNPYSFMARSALFVLSSRWEGLPNALIEALAVGTPVIATDCASGPSEILQDGCHGKLVPVGDASALARGILSTLDAPLPSIQLRGRAAAFRVEPIAAQYENLLLGQLGVDGT